MSLGSRQRKAVKMRQVNHILAAVLVIAFTLTMAWPRSATFAADPAFQVPTGERQLFLDDVDIAKIENLDRTMHQPNKKGAVIRPTYPAESGSPDPLRAPVGTPQARLWKIWLRNSGRPAFRQAYAESKDGLHWTKPSLGQVEVAATRENSYITIDEKLGWCANAIMNVVYRPETDPDPARRFKGGHLMAIARTVTPWASAGGPDGIHWRKLTCRPLPRRTSRT